jgi:hypothetical protein
MALQTGKYKGEMNNYGINGTTERRDNNKLVIIEYGDLERTGHELLTE